MADSKRSRDQAEKEEVKAAANEREAQQEREAESREAVEGGEVRTGAEGTPRKTLDPNRALDLPADKVTGDMKKDAERAFNLE